MLAQGAMLPASVWGVLILIEAPDSGGLGGCSLPTEYVLSDTDTLEKEASNAILYPRASVLLRRGSARALDVRVRAGPGGQCVGVQRYPHGARAVSAADCTVPRRPGGGSRVHVHLVLAPRHLRPAGAGGGAGGGGGRAGRPHRRNQQRE